MLFRQMLREHLFLVLGYQALLLTNIGAALAYWPDLRENIEKIPDVLMFVPSEMLRDMIMTMKDHGYWAYFGMQQLFKAGGVAAMVAASILGSLLIARDVDNRTAEFLFSRPISRTRLFLTRWVIGLAFVTVPFLISTLAALAAGPLFDESLPLGVVMLGQLHLSIFVMAVFSVSSMLSTFSDHQLKPALIVIGLLLLQLAIFMVKDLWSYSVYMMIGIDRLLPLEEGIYPWKSTLAFLAVTCLSLGTGLFKINRRDF